jgi:hypothetical protein
MLRAQGPSETSVLVKKEGRDNFITASAKESYAIKVAYKGRYRSF